jgi:hypothetical protein
MKFKVSIVVALISMMLLSGGIFAKEGKVAITPFAGIMTNGSSSFTVGAIVDWPLEKGLFLEGEAGIVFESTWLYAGGGVLYQFNLKNSPITPFIAGGAGIHYVSVDIGGISSSTTDFKLNAGGGVKFEISKGVMFRTEVRIYFLNGSVTRISAGVEL